jgi:hypothetical protein
VSARQEKEVLATDEKLIEPLKGAGVTAERAALEALSRVAPIIALSVVFIIYLQIQCEPKQGHPINAVLTKK